MKNKYQALFNQQVTKRQYIFDAIRYMTPERLTQRPESGAWSANEILHHLYLSEAGTLYILKKQFAKPVDTFERNTFISYIKSMWLNLLLQSNFKWKAAKIVSDMSELKTIEELEKEWQIFKTDMENLLQHIPAGLPQRVIFRHPRAGWINLYSTLQFLKYHQNHHINQIISRAGIL